jgi:hypothetical protein
MSHPLVMNKHKGDRFEVYVGRPSKWGNPFVIGRDGSRAEVLEKFERWLTANPALMSQLHELRGKRLGCFCAPLDCHADILARLANGRAEGNLSLFDGA